MSNLPASDQLHNATILIDEGKRKSSEGFLLIGSALSLVHEEKLWQGSHPSFDEFLTTQGISRSYGFKIMQAWRRFGERGKGIEPHRLMKLLPLKVENEAEVLEQAERVKSWRLA